MISENWLSEYEVAYEYARIIFLQLFGSKSEIRTISFVGSYIYIVSDGPDRFNPNEDEEFVLPITYLCLPLEEILKIEKEKTDGAIKEKECREQKRKKYEVSQLKEAIENAKNNLDVQISRYKAKTGEDYESK